MIIEDETEFCGEDLLHSVLQCKVRLCGWDWGAGELCVGGCGGLFQVF